MSQTVCEAIVCGRRKAWVNTHVQVKNCFSFFDALWYECSWINLFSKTTIDPFLNLRIQSWILPKKRTLSKNQTMHNQNRALLLRQSFPEAKPVKGSLKKTLHYTCQEKIVYGMWFRLIIITFPIFRFDVDLIIYKKGKKINKNVCDLPYKENHEIMYTLFNDYLVTLDNWLKKTK